MSLLIQQGYGKGDKINVCMEKKIVNGVILSPRDDTINNIEDLIKDIYEKDNKSKIIFDPQFYYSTYIDGTYKKLNDAEYFPGHIKLSELRSFRNINHYVTSTLDFQNDLGLGVLVSPTILVPNFSDRQAQISLSLAEESASYSKKIGKELLVSLVFKESALNETSNVHEFLNELTTLDVKGFYITVARNTVNYDQTFDDHTSLSNLLTMIYSLGEINEYEVIMGYSDIIGLLYLTVGATYISTGWHNSSKKFTEQQRILPVSGGRQPRERYTSIPLLNSIRTTELDSIYKQFNDDDFKIFLSNAPRENIIKTGTPSDGWSRNHSHIHHWGSLNKYISNIAGMTIEDRVGFMESSINNAKGLYRILDTNSIQLDPSSSGKHLSIWEDALKHFKEKHYIL